MKRHNWTIAHRMSLATFAGAILVGAYWIAFLGGWLGETDPAVRSFEGAFPLADSVLVAALVLASRGLIKGRSTGPFFLVCAAGMTFYLGLLDVLFYWRAGRYVPFGAAAGVQLLINGLCLGGGAIGLRFGWRLWGRREQVDSKAIERKLAA